jgi:hypothetical protein
MRIKAAAIVLVALALPGCGTPEYPFEFVNDLSQAVVVEGCLDCADGRMVEPGQSVPLKVEPDVIVRVTRADGIVVGCGYTPEGGGSTSDIIPTKASFLEGLVCDTAPGIKRRNEPTRS